MPLFAKIFAFAIVHLSPNIKSSPTNDFDETFQIERNIMYILNMGLSRNSFVLALLTSLTFPIARAADTETNSPPVQLTAQEDHQRLMGLLHMTSFRHRTTTNYEESKANPYPDIPDPLTLNNGEKVTTPEMWWQERRPEIVEDFDGEIYGRTPKETPKVTWEVSSVTNRVITNSYGSFQVVEKKLLGHVDNSSYTNISITIQLSLTLPVNAAGPSPVIMVLHPFAPGFGDGFPRAGFGGTNRPAGTNTPPRRGGFGGFGAFFELQPWQATVLSNGWGYATLGTYSIQGRWRRWFDRRYHRSLQQRPAAQIG